MFTTRAWVLSIMFVVHIENYCIFALARATGPNE